MLKNIKYNSQTKDYDLFINDRYVGSRYSFVAAQAELDRLAYEELTHSPTTAAIRAARAICAGSDLKEEIIKALEPLGNCRPAYYSEQAELFAHAVTAILGESHFETDCLLFACFSPEACEQYMPEEPDGTIEGYLSAEEIY